MVTAFELEAVFDGVTGALDAVFKVVEEIVVAAAAVVAAAIVEEIVVTAAVIEALVLAVHVGANVGAVVVTEGRVPSILLPAAGEEKKG